MQGSPAGIFCSFSGAENESRDIHPLQGLHLYGEDATENHRKPMIFRVLVWLASLCPSGEPWFPTSLLSPPLEKGLNAISTSWFIWYNGI